MKPALTVVGVVLVALFIQKSDGNTAVQTLLALLMATVGCLLMQASVIGLKARHRKHEHRLRIVFSNTTVVCLGGLAGGLLLWASFLIIDRSPEVFGTSDVVDISDHSGIALRNPQLALGTTTIRLLVTVVNNRDRPVVADQAEFTMWWGDSVECNLHFGDHLEGYKLIKEDLKLNVGKTTGADLQAVNGPLRGHRVKGFLVISKIPCDFWRLSVTVPVSLALAPFDNTHLFLELPSGLPLPSSITQPKTSKIEVSKMVDAETLGLRFRTRFGGEKWSCVSQPYGELSGRDSLEREWLSESRRDPALGCSSDL